MRLPSLAWTLLAAIVALAACNKHEGDIPLAVANAPQCAPGVAPAELIVVDIQTGNGHYIQGLGDQEHMHLGSGMIGKKATVKVGHGSPTIQLAKTPFANQHETVVGGSERLATVELPFVQMKCADGTFVQNKDLFR